MEEPFLTAGIAPVAAKFKAWAEDFIVEEVPLYPPLGSGNHLYLWIEKSRRTTPEVARALSESTGARLRDIGYAGMKDKQGVTRQWFSLPAQAEAKLGRFKLEGAAILSTTRHRNKLKTGHLKGNRFVITLRGAFSEGDCARAAAVLEELAKRGVPNFYGRQRFSGGPEKLEAARGLLAAPPARGLHWDEKFALQVLQSAIFNGVLSDRIARGLFDKILPGDLALTVPWNGLFLVEDAAEVQVRRERLAAVASGPQPGPEMRQPESEALAVEQAAIAAGGWSALDFSRSPMAGSRRAFAVTLENAEARLEDGLLRLAFALPSGAYATNVVREILKQAV